MFPLNKFARKELIDGSGIYSEIALRWMSPGHTDD